VAALGRREFTEKSAGTSRWFVVDLSNQERWWDILLTTLRDYPPAGRWTDGYPEVLNGNSGKHSGQAKVAGSTPLGEGPHV